MKTVPVLCLLAAVLWGGCTSRYNITLNNSEVITAKGKPRFDKDKNGFYFIDAFDKTNFVSAMKVTQIAPQSMAQDDQPKFKQPQTK